MPIERGGLRAIVLDLDDTLYPERRFALSGFAAVARHAADVHGVPARKAFRILCRSLSGGRRHRAFQDLAIACGLPEEVIPRLLATYRRHDPRLRLPRDSRRALIDLRRSWRIGILTNGDPDIQARKVAALGLSPYVDAIVFAERTGAAKPAACAFAAVLDRLDARPQRSVFVGDHPICDIAGARAIGMKTIRVKTVDAVDAAPGCEAHHVVESMAAVPDAAAALVGEEDRHHA